jgi:hypothetical protein
MNRTFLLLISVALSSLACAGDLDSAAAKLERPAYDTVKTAEHFAIGRVGAAGIISAQETAFRQLLKQPDAVALCQKLLNDGTPAGQLYGLLGLRLLDQKAFQTALPRYADSKTDIETVRGCIVTHTTAGALAQQIEKGELK